MSLAVACNSLHNQGSQRSRGCIPDTPTLKFRGGACKRRIKEELCGCACALNIHLLGLCVNRLYGGTYLHADDIRTLSTSATTLQEQITQVNTFAKNNAEPSKCEIASFSKRSDVPHPVYEIENTTLPSRGTAKCLRFQWHRNLLARPSIEYNILKAVRSFFAYGIYSMGLFQGLFSPVSDGYLYPAGPLLWCRELVFDTWTQTNFPRGTLK